MCLLVQWSPGPQALDRYQAMGHLVPGHRGRIVNFLFFYYLALNIKKKYLFVSSIYGSSLDTCLGHVIRYC